MERPVSENEEETDSGDDEDDEEEDLQAAIQLSLSLTEVFFFWLVDLLKSKYGINSTNVASSVFFVFCCVSAADRQS